MRQPCIENANLRLKIAESSDIADRYCRGSVSNLAALVEAVNSARNFRIASFARCKVFRSPFLIEDSREARNRL